MAATMATHPVDILFIDDAQFTLDGITTTRNLHCLAHENQHEVAEYHFQQ
jgi:hypothetical protein